MNIESATKELLAKESIREIVGSRYARAIDWRDVEMLKSCFHADAVVDYGYFKGNAHEWCKGAVARDPNRIHRFHYIYYPQVEVKGDKGQSEGTTITGRRYKEDGVEKLQLVGARYFDTLESRDGKWRMSSRVIKLEFNQVLPHGAASGPIEFLADIDPQHKLFRSLYSE